MSSYHFGGAGAFCRPWSLGRPGAPGPPPLAPLLWVPRRRHPSLAKQAWPRQGDITGRGVEAQRAVCCLRAVVEGDALRRVWFGRAPVREDMRRLSSSSSNYNALPRESKSEKV